MFISKIITFLEVVRGYEDLLVEVSWHGDNKGGNICTYTYKHPSDNNNCTLSLMTLSNKNWSVTLQGRVTLDTIINIFGKDFYYSMCGSKSTTVESIPEARAIFSNEELLPLMERFKNS